MTGGATFVNAPWKDGTSHSAVSVVFDCVTGTQAKGRPRLTLTPAVPCHSDYETLGASSLRNRPWPRPRPSRRGSGSRRSPGRSTLDEVCGDRRRTGGDVTPSLSKSNSHGRVRRWRRNRRAGIRGAGARSGVDAAFDRALGRRTILTLGTTIVRRAALDVLVRERCDGGAGVRIARGCLDHDATLGGAFVGGAILALRAVVVWNAADHVSFHRVSSMAAAPRDRLSVPYRRALTASRIRRRAASQSRWGSTTSSDSTIGSNWSTTCSHAR